MTSSRCERFFRGKATPPEKREAAQSAITEKIKMFEQYKDSGNRPRNPVTVKFLDLLLQIQPGKVVTYDRLTEFVGAKVPHACRSQLTTARKRLEVEQGIWFKAARVGKNVVGLKRMDGGATCLEADGMRRRIHTMAKRNRSRLLQVTDAELGAIPASARVQGVAGEAIMGAVAKLTHGKNFNRTMRAMGSRTSMPHSDNAKAKTANQALAAAAQGNLFDNLDMPVAGPDEADGDTMIS
jgi:hypothetical protein